jgi:hypothetical protein
MTLGNTRELGVHHLMRSASTTPAEIRLSSYLDDVVPWFQRRIKRGKCGQRKRWVDVRPNWKEKPGMPDDWEGRPAWEKKSGLAADHKQKPRAGEPGGALRGQH